MKGLKKRLIPVVIISFLCVMILPFAGHGQTRPDGTSPQFLNPGFTQSNVRFKNGQIKSVILNYNIVSEKMVYQTGKDLFDMTNTELIDTVYLQKSKFIPAGTVFYEVLLVAPVSLFVQHKGTVESPGAPAGYGGTSQVSNTKQLSGVELAQGYFNLELPSDYTVKADPVYWIRKDNTMSSYVVERQFLKIFPDKEKELKQYIKQNRIKFGKLTDMVKLVRYCNEIIK